MKKFFLKLNEELIFLQAKCCSTYWIANAITVPTNRMAANVFILEIWILQKNLKLLTSKFEMLLLQVSTLNC